MPEPTWRERESDWDQDAAFEPALLAGETDAPADQSWEPWSFDQERSEVPGGPGYRGGRAAEEEPAWAETETAPTGRHEAPAWESDTPLGAGEPTTEIHLDAPAAGLHEAEDAEADDIFGEPEAEPEWTGRRRRPWLGRRREALDEADEWDEGEAAPPGAPTEPWTPPTRQVSGMTAGASGRLQVSSRPTAAAASGAVARRPRRGAEAGGGQDRLSERTGRNLPAAIAIGVLVGALTLIACFFGSVPAMVVVTLAVALAAAEAYTAFRRGGYHPATLLGLVATVGLVVATYAKGDRALPIVLVLLVALTMVWHLIGVDRQADPVRSTAATLFVFVWVGVFGSFAALLLAPSNFPLRHGVAYLLGAIITGVGFDIGALAVGAWIGRHPLSAASPNKTWEGVLGGAVLALLLAVIVVRAIHPWTLGRALVLAIVASIVSPVGDLGESMVKRHLGLKDMGRILPGHGGVLDRVDGLLFVLPATFYLVKAFHMG
jgi:phosphatidate cytidylyltransferase